MRRKSKCICQRLNRYGVLQFNTRDKEGLVIDRNFGVMAYNRAYDTWSVVCWERRKEEAQRTVARLHREHV